jgi:aspartyl-tRNA(Asn)/glutamyl-tRNA(Gln) amidotransferase subunit C
MKIDNDTVDKIAHLARLEFEKEAKAKIIKDINNMLAFVEKLNELNTDGVKPLIYMTDDPDSFEVDNLREDEVKGEMTQAEALMNAPKKDSDYFKVPKVVEKK